MMPVVSIVTPTYNRSLLLKRVWNSLKKQSLKNFEWVIVDDGSTDNTKKIIETFDDRRIRYFFQENKGVNFARNMGDKEIRADYVVYLDSDDELYSENTLNMMVSKIKATNYEIASVSFSVVDGKTGRKMCHIPDDNFQADYLDVISEKKYQVNFLRYTDDMSVKYQHGLNLMGWKYYGIGE